MSDDPRGWIARAQARCDATLALPLVSSAAAHAITAGRADQRLALAALTKVLDRHRPYRIYDDCGHVHNEGEPGVREVDEVGSVCEDGLLYVICYECCTGGSGYHSEECATNHAHGPDVPYCSTVRDLAAALAGEA